MLNDYKINVEVFKDQNYLELPFKYINNTKIRTNLSFVWFVQIEGDELKSYLINSDCFNQELFDVYFSIKATVKKINDKFYIYTPDIFMDFLSVDYKILVKSSDGIEYYKIGEDTSLNYYKEYIRNPIPLYYNNILKYNKRKEFYLKSPVNILNLKNEKFLILSLYKKDSEYFAIYTKINEHVIFEDFDLISRVLIRIYNYNKGLSIGIPIPKKISKALDLIESGYICFSCYLNNNMFFFRIKRCDDDSL